MAPPATTMEDDDAYHSASDSDFDAHVSPSSGDESASSEDEGQKKEKRPRKRKHDSNQGLEIDSGDEGIIAQGRKKKRRKHKHKSKKGTDADAGADAEDDEEEEAGGIRVRLRSGRGGDEKTSKAIPQTSAATIDVDAVWARLNAPAVASPAPLPPPRPPSPGKENVSPSKPLPSILEPPAAEEETITIPSTYTFAGETHTTQKTVPVSSPEAQAYLTRQQVAQSRPPRPLARKNLLEPNPSRLVKGKALPPRTDLPPTIGGSMEKGKSLEKQKGKGKEVKLNTVEKSKLDWEAEVEREGMREELEKAGKSGKDYLGRMEFLGRVDEGRDERERAARLAGKA